MPQNRPAKHQIVSGTHGRYESWSCCTLHWCLLLCGDILRDGQCINEGAQIIPSMTYFRAERSSSSNVGKGGIMIMASEELLPVSVNPCVPGLEYTSVSVTKCETQVNIITIDRSPLMSSPLFKQRLHVLLESLDKTVLTVILGDFQLWSTRLTRT